MAIDTLSQALSNIMNAEKVGKSECLAQVSSKLIMKVLDIMQAHGYIKSYERIEDNKGGLLKIALMGSINKCGVIKPRFASKNTEFEKWEKRYLPAKDFGILVVSTPQGVMTHYQAKEKKLGGRLLAYCY